jgi:hypothetical protein
MLGPPAHPAVLRQEHPQPARTDMYPRLLLQIGRQPLRGPDVERWAQSARQRLQRGFHRCHIRCVCPHGPAHTRCIGQRRHPACSKAGQPVPHRLDRAPTPARNPLHLIAQGRCFDHLQPLAHTPPEIGALQLPLDLRVLLWGEGEVSSRHAPPPCVLLPRAPTPTPRMHPAGRSLHARTTTDLARIR